jgi:hypothetical protein
MPRSRDADDGGDGDPAGTDRPGRPPAPARDVDDRATRAAVVIATPGSSVKEAIPI